MDRIRDLFKSQLTVANVGAQIFAESVRMQGGKVVEIDWSMPCRGDERLLSILDRIRTVEFLVKGEPVRLESLIEDANRHAFEVLNESHPFIVGLGRAGEDIPGMRDDLILHAGPPIEWDRMCGPMRGAVIGALIYEGRAEDAKEAERIASSGGVTFEPCHHHSAVGPMAGVISPSMPVWIVENKRSGGRAFSTLNEGLGKVLRYGAFGEEVIERLRWMEKVLASVLREALAIHGEVDLRVLIAQALEMGDEGHNRNKAGTSLLIRELAPSIAAVKAGAKDRSDVLKFMNANDHFFLNLSMPAAKSCLDDIAGIDWCTLVTAMARNGTDFGIRLSSLGDRWFSAPAPRVKGLYFTGFDEEDANPDIGDSTICETYGIGGLAMAAAPAIVEFVGGTPADARAFTLSMYAITAGESRNYRIPALGFRGTPTGIDVVKVVDKGIVPAVNTGIAHRSPGIGQVGAGLVEPPVACFENAFAAFCETLSRSRGNDKEDWR